MDVARASLGHAQRDIHLVTAADVRRLASIVADPKSPQKHVWRSRIILSTADGVGTTALMAATGKSKTCVWRWQERFMEAGIDGLLRDKTSRRSPRTGWPRWFA